MKNFLQPNRFVVLLVAMLTMSFTNVWGAETAAYTLTPVKGTNSAYAGDCDIAIDGIKWNVTGNSSLTPWRLGGKAASKEAALTADRTIYSKDSIADSITSVVVSNGAASGITINSFTLTVASDDEFNDVISTVSGTFEASSTTTFACPAGANWKGRYYKFTYNVTVTATSNKFVEFVGAVFNKEKKESEPSLSVSPASIEFDDVEVGTTSVEGKTVTVTIENIAEVLAYMEMSASSPFSIDKESLTESGTITVTPLASTLATVGEYSDTLTITDAEELTKKVPVSIKVTEPVVAEKGFKLVTDASVLKAGDELILGAAITSGETTNYFAAGAFGANKFFSSTSATVADNEISAPEAIIIKLGGNAGAWTFTTSEGLVGTKAAKALVLSDKDATTTWTISIDESKNAIITSTGEGLGSIQYNSGSPRFLNYATAQKPIQLYRRAKGTSTPTPVTEITAVNATDTVAVGDKLTLQYTIVPDTATDKRVEFAIVYGGEFITLEEGVVTGVAEGDAQVSVMALDSLNEGTKLSATYSIHVKASSPKPVLQDVNTIENIIACYDAGVVQKDDLVKVTGYISNMFLKPNNFAKYGSVTVWLCSDKEGVGTDKEFQLYNCYGQDGDTLAYFGPNYTQSGSSNVDVDTVIGRAGNQFVKGDSVVAYGKILKYQQIYELQGGCYFVSGGVVPTAIKAAKETALPAKKIMVNGQMVIVRDDKMYNALGVEL